VTPPKATLLGTKKASKARAYNAEPNMINR
jgi:hypothetical protein